MQRDTDDSAAGDAAGPTDEQFDQPPVPADDPEWGPDPARTWATGERAPAPPTATDAVRLAAASPPDDDAEALTCVRVVVEDRGEGTERDVLGELHTEPAVVGTTVSEPFGPGRPDRFDVLVAPEHDSLLATSAMSTLDRVDGAAFASYPVDAFPESVDAVAEAPNGSVDGAAPGDDAGTDGETRGEDADGEPPDFEQLRSEVSAAEYEDVVSELERMDVESPGADVDIDALLAESTVTRQPPAGTDSEEPADGADDASMVVGQPASSLPDAGSGAEPTDAGGGRNLDPEAVLSALVTALERRTLRESELGAFREALGVSTPESLRARVDHLGSRVNELDAYRSELAAFIDETEGGRRVDSLAADVERLAARVDELATATERLDERTARQAERLSELADADGDPAVADGDSAADEAFDRLDRRLDALAEDLAALSAEVEDLRDWKENLHTAFAEKEE